MKASTARLNGSLHDKVAFDGIATDKVESSKLPTFDALNELAMPTPTPSSPVLKN